MKDHFETLELPLGQQGGVVMVSEEPERTSHAPKARGSWRDAASPFSGPRDQRLRCQTDPYFLISYNHAILFRNEKKKTIEVAGISKFFALVFRFAPRF